VWLDLRDGALERGLFATLQRRVKSLGDERLARTYQTTFWFALGTPACIVERAVLALRPFVPTRGVRGVEWWLSRMWTHDVEVDFHRDRDEKRALRGGRELHPSRSSVLFLNRVRGGALAVTAAPPCDDNPARAPTRLALDLAAPRPNRFVHFDGRLTHGVLDAANQIPGVEKRARGQLRLALIFNWWRQRPEDVPTFRDSRAYRSLAL
jgi:hypothetical protein